MVTKQAQQAVGAVRQTAEKVAPEVAEKVTGKVADKVTEKVSEKLPALSASDQLNASLRKLAGTITSRAVTSLTGKLTSATGRLTEYAAAGGSGGLLKAITGGEGGSKVKRKALFGALKGGLSGAAEQVRDKVSSLFGGKDDSKGAKIKLTNIIEDIDIGAPIDLVYDQWTRFTDFPSFLKKVEDVGQESDEKLRWKAQIFWSHRTWESTIVEQVPYERIVWRSKGQKGYVDGAVTFHDLAPNLTRVVVVLEYHPQGLFERTGNIWRAQGRRVRLELKHFRRHVMSHAILRSDEIEGWHGEIRDGQVVSTGEEEPEEGQVEEGQVEEGREYEEEPEEESRRERVPAGTSSREGSGR